MDKTKEKPVRPFLRGHSASNILINNTGACQPESGGLGLSANNSSGFANLRRNNSLSKEEKQVLNIRKQQEQMNAADEKENEDNRYVLTIWLFGPFEKQLH